MARTAAAAVQPANGQLASGRRMAEKAECIDGLAILVEGGMMRKMCYERMQSATYYKASKKSSFKSLSSYVESKHAAKITLLEMYVGIHRTRDCFLRRTR